MASQMTITQNLLNCLNRIDTNILDYEAIVNPTSFSNAPTVDDGRNIVCMQGINGGIVDGVWDHTADPTTQRLIRLARGGKLVKGPDSPGSSASPAIWTPSLEKSSNWYMRGLDLDLRPLFGYSNGIAIGDFGKFSTYSGGNVIRLFVGLIQGQNSFSINSVDFTGKMLAAGSRAIQDGNINGAKSLKITETNDSTLTQLDSIVLSCYMLYSSLELPSIQPLIMPIMAAVSLSSPIELERNDTIQVTLNLSSSYSLS